MQTMDKPQTHDMATVDEIRNRIGATYGEAQDALDQSQGDMLRAIVIIEENRRAEASEEVDLVDRIFNIAEEGIHAVRLRVGNKYAKEIPVGMGAFGSLLAALAVGFLSEITLEAVKGE